MYLKFSLRRHPQTQEPLAYYRLVESYRNETDRVCHRTLCNIGFWTELTLDQKQKVVDHLNSLYDHQTELFEETDEAVRIWVDRLWQLMIDKKTIDRKQLANRHRLINVDTIKHKEAREIGTEWICAQTWNKLGLSELFAGLGWSESKVQLAMTQVISRAVYPASELASSKWIRENSAICDLTGYDVNKITKDKLYGSALSLYDQKDVIEKQLSIRTNELFDLQDRIIIYDLTNTYFEGEKRKSRIAKFGRSKEKRSDAKLVVLAMVVNMEGFIKYSSIHEGNYSDSSGLEEIVSSLAYSTSQSKPIVVMDAGIATEQNLSHLRKKGYSYMVVSRTKLKAYKPVQEGKQAYLVTKSKKVIRLQSVRSEHHEDYFLKVESPAKRQKESGIQNRLETGYEHQLSLIAHSLTKPRGTKQKEKVLERIGRAKQKYPSVHSRYEIELTEDPIEKKVTAMNWFRKTMSEEIHPGVYFLRTNLQTGDEALEWMIYNTIREIESTFRVLKTDLDLRPVFHQRDESSMAHLHLGILAYWLVNTIRHQLKTAGIHDDWKEIRRKASTQKSVITTAQNDYGSFIQIKRCTEPTADLMKIHEALSIKPKPYLKLKSVVHKLITKKLETLTISQFNSG